MSNIIKRIVIVGGGSAGWLTAGMIAAEHSAKTNTGLQVTLVESPDVSIIGVGEGTWPSMRNTLQKIGLAETDFIRECSVSFKQGSKFVGWRNGQTNDFYYHPFMLPQAYTETNLASAWGKHWSDLPYADAFSIQAQLCEAGFAPKQITTPEYAAVTNYGYHLDAGKFVMLLQKHCTETLGVKHILDHVTEINSASSGDIASLSTQSSGKIEGDLFIDCSGTAALLLGKHYKIPFIQQKHVLFNDSAMATQVPYASADSPIASATISTAQTAGWIWDIGLPTRRGVGHTYSSSHTTDEQAEKELRAYIAKSHGEKVAESIPARKLSFNPGHHEKFWHKNCVAVGMTAGFLEPLEASALAMVELSANFICEEMPVTREHMAITEKRFNDRFVYHWGRVIDFLKLHYILTKRTDSDYWRDNCRPETISKRLQDLLVLWQTQSPSFNDFTRNSEIFPSASYQYVLYGMGFKTQARPTARRFDNDALAKKVFDENQLLLKKCSAALPTNRALIDNVHQYGFQKI
jgi:tryptophan 7-halogenase